jgi:hypothetical protein
MSASRSDGLLSCLQYGKLASMPECNTACKHAGREAGWNVSRLASQHANMQACQPESKHYSQPAGVHDSRMDSQSVSLLACWPGVGEGAQIARRNSDLSEAKGRRLFYFLPFLEMRFYAFALPL